MAPASEVVLGVGTVASRFMGSRKPMGAAGGCLERRLIECNDVKEIPGSVFSPLAEP